MSRGCRRPSWLGARNISCDCREGQPQPTLGMPSPKPFLKEPLGLGLSFVASSGMRRKELDGRAMGRTIPCLPRCFSNCSSSCCKATGSSESLEALCPGVCDLGER